MFLVVYGKESRAQDMQRAKTPPSPDMIATTERLLSDAFGISGRALCYIRQRLRMTDMCIDSR